MNLVQQDWVLVATLVGVAVLLTSFMWVAYNSQLVWELKLEHQKALERMNAEMNAVRDKLAGREIRDRVMGSVPVGRLLDPPAEHVILDDLPKPDIWKGEM